VRVQPVVSGLRGLVGSGWTARLRCASVRPRGLQLHLSSRARLRERICITPGRPVATSAIQTARDLGHQKISSARAAYFAADRASLCVGALFGPEGNERIYVHTIKGAFQVRIEVFSLSLSLSLSPPS
jgi:hypothetical protein